MLNSTTPYRRDENATLRVPVVVADVPLQAAVPALSFAPSDGGGDAALAPASSPPPTGRARS